MKMRHILIQQFFQKYYNLFRLIIYELRKNIGVQFIWEIYFLSRFSCSGCQPELYKEDSLNRINLDEIYKNSLVD
jgi:hypothetical protein